MYCCSSAFFSRPAGGHPCWATGERSLALPKTFLRTLEAFVLFTVFRYYSKFFVFVVPIGYQEETFRLWPNKAEKSTCIDACMRMLVVGQQGLRIEKGSVRYFCLNAESSKQYPIPRFLKLCFDSNSLQVCFGVYGSTLHPEVDWNRSMNDLKRRIWTYHTRHSSILGV